jgi:CubicO group peptidase (beta-lactamase class C family)
VLRPLMRLSRGADASTAGRHLSVSQALLLTVAVALASSAAFTPVVAAESAVADTAAVDHYIAAEMRAQKIPGLSLAVRHAERLVYVKSYGVATLEHPVAASADTLFQIGSIGKQFTAAAAMLLARDGKLSLDDPLAKYLPEIPPTWSDVTLRLMLNHQSGIAQLTPPARDLLDLHHDYTDAEYIRLATSVPLDFRPGTDVSYSDTAYVLLGFVLNRVAGQFYGDFLSERVFRPLGMSRTRVVSDADIIVGRASGYELRPDGALRNQSWVAPALNRTADGSLYSTVLDLARWDEALSARRILDGEELERMWSVESLHGGGPPFFHYGYGWVIDQWRGHRVIEYDGNWQGFQAAMARYEDRHLTVIVLTNLALCRTQRIAHSVAALFDTTLSRLDSPVSDSRPQLTMQLREFLADAERRAAITLPLTAAGRKLLTASWIGALGRELRASGPIISLVLVGETQEPAALERVYRLDTKEMVDFLSLRYTADGTVDSVSAYQEY